MLIVPFVILVALAVGLVGYLSFRNGQQAVNEVAHQLRGELTTRIEEHLLTFLNTPHQINQSNANALRQGWLEANDPKVLERHFWEQVQIFDSVTSIYFGNTAGGLVNAGREGAEGTLYVIGTDRFMSGPFKKYATDSQGNRTELLLTVPDFDARTRPWYTGAVKRRSAAWSKVYILFTGQDMAIAASRPVYDEQQKLLGVVSVDLFLSHLSNFLQSLKIGQTGQAFIMERSGLLVAASTAEKPFIQLEEDGAQRRLYASESANPLIRYAAETLAEGGSYHHITGPQHLEFEIEGERQFLQVSPVKNEDGLDWLIVVVIPEADFMAQINANNRATVSLMTITLAMAVIAGVIAARRISRPMIRLNESVQALAQGRRIEAVEDESRVEEISELTQSFNSMVGQLQQMLENLTAEISERRQTEKALRESEERLELVLEGAELGLWDWNVPTGSVVFNGRWAEILDYSLAEIEPKVSSWEKLMHPDEVSAVMAVLAAHLEGRTPIYQTEHRLRAKSGDWKWILDTGKVFVRDEKGKPIRAVGIHQDITERKRAEEALRESNHRLETALAELKATQDRMVQQERLAAVGQLAAGIAHDFNNILTSMLGYAELLNMSPDTTEAMQTDLAKIIGSGQRAANLVRQMLDFSRKSFRQPKALDLALLIKEAVKSLEQTLSETIHFSLEIQPGEYLVEADSAQIRQLLTNLALNARDAMPAGGNLQVILSWAETRGEVNDIGHDQAREGEWITLRVTDTGIGIPPEVLPHIFEPFFTTKEVGQGSGLGLSQVLGIIQQHAGHITVSSQVGHGTTFTCYLPPLTPRQREPGPVDYPEQA